MAATTWLCAVILLSLTSPAYAAIDWSSLISQTRQLSMSGILGLVEADILYANPGTQQKEIWRILQAMVGIGSLRVIAKICKAPCFEFLHAMHGIKLPESVNARDFWLNQPSWTEISLLGLTQEDTSYHRINQGSGPQARVLWNRAEIELEREWWEEESHSIDNMAAFRRSSALATTMTLPERKGSEFLTVVSEVRPGAITPTPSIYPREDSTRQGLTPAIYRSRRGNRVTEGTTDKWWMDRWQIEVVAVAAIRRITVGEASELLTVAYFGHAPSRTFHAALAGVCVFLALGTFATAMLTDWSWTVQFAALTCLGYFVNHTSSLRAWKFEPSPALKEARPVLLDDWPSTSDNRVILRVAVQSSGFCHLRGLFALEPQQMKGGKEVAKGAKGRYPSLRREIPTFAEPYSRATEEHGYSPSNWVSYEAQSSFYGLISSLAPDNVRLRSLSVILTGLVGLVLLVMGFGGTTLDGWDPIVLGIYMGGIIIAVLSRGRSERWTLPEFEVIDLTRMDVPPAVLKRIWKMKGAECLPNPNSRGRASRTWDRFLGRQDEKSAPVQHIHSSVIVVG